MLLQRRLTTRFRAVDFCEIQAIKQKKRKKKRPQRALGTCEPSFDATAVDFINSVVILAEFDVKQSLSKVALVRQQVVGWVGASLSELGQDAGPSPASDLRGRQALSSQFRATYH